MDPHQEYHDRQAPEAVNTSYYPEAVVPNHHYQQQYVTEQPTGVKPEDGLVPGSHLSGGTPYSNYGGSQFDHVGAEQGSDDTRKKKSGTILGCTTLVFVLCVVIALLAAAVVGLAAGTGVEAHRASVAEARAEDQCQADASASSCATATVTATSSAPTSTPFAAIDDNCSGNPGGVTGTTYKAFKEMGNYSFTIQCNTDASGAPLMSLFTADLNTCMDACASWSNYLPGILGNDTTSANISNATCGAVSFIPSWTNKTAALGNGAPGNCYLKPTQTAPATTPSGQEVHAGILQST